MPLILPNDYLFIDVARAASSSCWHWFIDNHGGTSIGKGAYDGGHWVRHCWPTPRLLKDSTPFAIHRPYRERLESWCRRLEHKTGKLITPEEMGKKDWFKELRWTDEAIAAIPGIILLDYHDLPDCLLQLPFVDDVSNFPHRHNSRGASRV